MAGLLARGRWWLLSGLAVLAIGAVTVGLLLPKLKSDEPDPPGTRLDEAALTACSELADGMYDADTAQGRVDLTNRVVESAKKSRTANFADHTAALNNTADGPEGGLWLAAAQSFVIMCRENGWSRTTPA